MHIAASSKRTGLVGGAPAPTLDAFSAPDAYRIIAEARQGYLDALPIAAALITVGPDEKMRIDMTNAGFRRLAELADGGGSVIADVPFLRASGLGAAIADFLSGGERVRQFEGGDGQNIAPRHFTVRLARLAPTPEAERRCILSLLDRTAQVETEQNLRTEMLRDSLSGLPNRAAFNERIEALLADPDFTNGCHAVLVIDLTRFSRVNECVGATAGDELLISFARRLLSALRPHDMLARTGGDEFAVLVRLRDGIQDAVQVARRIESVLAGPFRLSELEIRVDCAIGCARVSRSVEVADEVLRNGQFALKRAKQSGRIEIYEPKQARAARRRFSIETELRRAIEAEQLTLAFQPVIELGSGRVAGFEALARWRHEERGDISPTDFIPVAEESGLIVPLGRWVIQRAVATLAEWDARIAASPLIALSVNVSPIQIVRDDIAAVVAHALDRHGIAGERLTIELTESAIIQDPDRTKAALHALKALRLYVAMDDFGTGFTSLASLQRLPIDVLKIDQSFVLNMLKDGDSVAIVRAMLSLASALGIATTAEGIENAETARMLTALGCSYGQGFLYSEALESDAALEFFVSRNA